MKQKTMIICLILYAGLTAQSLDYYIPAGFNNPFLKSGQFITTFNYYQHRSVMDNQEQESANLSKNWQFSGYLGLIDGFTLRADLSFYPSQTVSEIVSGGAGESNHTSYISPTIVLSYRPTGTLEIFGDLTYSNYTRQQGPRTYYQDVPVGVNPDGSLIYERRPVTQPALPDMDIKYTSIRMGISYYGNLW